VTPELTTLDNGLRIVSLTLPRVETVSIGLYAGVGARFETADINGISHFLEHMVFKGSKRRSARMLAEAVEDVGGNINAYTARDVTGYYIRLLKDDAPLAMDILSDLVFGAVLDDREVEKERDVVLQEIGQVYDTPDDLVFDMLQQSAFPDQPLGAPILGTPKTVAEMSGASLHQFRATHYVGGNLILSAAGNIEHGALVEMALQYFDGVPSGDKITPGIAIWSAGDRRIARPSEQMHLALGFPAVGLEDSRVYAVQVLSTILGGGMSSRLFQHVREDNGLAYSIFSDVSAHAGVGMLSIYAGTSPQDAARALDLIAQCCVALKSADDERELKRAKAQLKTGLAMALESSASLSEQIGRQQLAFGRTFAPEELIEKVDAVTLADVRQMAQLCFTSDVAFACVGPKAELPAPDALKALFG